MQLFLKKPRCVVLDLNLPGVDGFELCRKINADNSYGKPAVIVVTALESKEDENRIVDLGIEKFFRKPLKLELLADVVNRVFKD